MNGVSAYPFSHPAGYRMPGRAGEGPAGGPLPHGGGVLSGGRRGGKDTQRGAGCRPRSWRGGPAAGGRGGGGEVAEGRP